MIRSGLYIFWPEYQSNDLIRGQSMLIFLITGDTEFDHVVKKLHASFLPSGSLCSDKYLVWRCL